MEEIRTEILGNFLREKRKHHKMTLEKLARLTDTTVGTLSTIENGLKSPKLELLEKILIALEIPKDEFIDEIETRAIQDKEEIGQTFAIVNNLKDYFENLEAERKAKYFKLLSQAIEIRAVAEEVLLSHREIKEIASLAESIVRTRINQIKR